ncbi:MAG TPA: DUF2089 domain-containing protein [Deinococcales bacterium]|nr:DUF2089 domain-containing protein [Deinococcales bacterium]
MLLELPVNLPGVDEQPIVTGLEFENAGVRLNGRFRLNEFATLPPEALEFLRLYIRVRGNLKEVERIMGVSYPTVRARFETMLRALGYDPQPSADDARDQVLSALERGDINADEAFQRLSRL